ncbi:unnamed protein product, partial [Choristocarpus tenellus]
MVVDKEAPAAESLWQSMLRDAMRKNRLPDGTVVFVGPKGSGKSTLLDTFQGSSGFYNSVAKDTPEGGQADLERQAAVAAGVQQLSTLSRNFHPVLAYSYFDAVDPNEQVAERDDSPSRVGVWCCSEMEFETLMGTVLQPEGLQHTIAMIGLDLSRPWELIEALETWTKVLESHFIALLQQLSVGAQDDLRDRVKKSLRVNGAGGGSGDDAPQLEDVVLERNLGVPLVVVCCKADTLQNETFEQQQRLHYIQQHLRRFCLRYGAALVYTSAKEGVNCVQLQRYMLSQLYPGVFTFTEQGQVTDAAFIPSGWDSKRLIDDLLAEDKTPWGRGKDFADVISPLSGRRGSGLASGGGGGGGGGDGLGGGQGLGREYEEDEDEVDPEQKWLGELSKAFAADGKGRKMSTSVLPSATFLPSSSSAASTSTTAP